MPGTICCAGGTSHSSTVFTHVSCPGVLVSLFHQGLPPHQDQVFLAGPSPPTGCLAPALAKASTSARTMRWTRGTKRRRRRQGKGKPREGNSPTPPPHHLPSTSRRSWVPNTRAGAPGQEDVADRTQETRARTRHRRRVSRGCPAVRGKSTCLVRMPTMTALRGTSAQSK